MAAPKRIDLIKHGVYAPLGAPVLPRELELDPVGDVSLALIEYYKFIPIKVAVSYTITDAREIVVLHSDVCQQANLGDTDDDYFYVGVIHHAMRSQIGQNAFNQNLLGLNVGVPIADPMENLQMATMIDISTGDPYYEEDFDRNQTRWVLGGSGNLSVTYGVGTWDVEKTPVRHLRLVSMLVGKTYYERLIAVRKTGQFNAADFRISTDQLEAVKTKNDAEITQYIEAVGYMAITVG